MAKSIVKYAKGYSFSLVKDIVHVNEKDMERSLGKGHIGLLKRVLYLYDAKLVS